jgi:hypothetical protein
MSTSQKAIHSMDSLHNALRTLEQRQSSEGEALREHFRLTYETMRPANLIKSALTEVTQSQDLKDHLVSTGVGLVAGHASKAVFESVSDSPMKGLVGTAIQFGITNAVARHPEVVLAASRGVLRMLRSAWRSRNEASEKSSDAQEHPHNDPNPASGE